MLFARTELLFKEDKIEIHHLNFQRQEKEAAKEKVEQIRISNLKIVPIDEEVAVKAGKYKIRPIPIPIVDTLITASPYLSGAKVVF